MEKECKTCCEIKPIDEYYSRGDYCYAHCIDCFNMNRKMARYHKRLFKKNPFEMLDEETKERLLLYFTMKFDLPLISHLIGINLHTLRSWIIKDWIPTYREYFGSIEIKENN